MPSADILLANLGKGYGGPTGAPVYGPPDPFANNSGSGIIQTNSLANGGIAPPPFPPINYSPITNYLQPPDTSGGMTNSNGLNLYVIIGLLVAAAVAIFIIVR